MKASVIIIFFFFMSLDKASAQWETTLPNHCEAVCINPLNASEAYCASVWKLFKSIDSGKHWAQICSLPLGAGIRQICLPGNDSNILLLNAIGADSLRGTYRSCDGGETFNKVCQASSNGRTIQVQNDSIFAVGRYPPAIWYSVDEGESWKKKMTRFPVLNPMSELCAYYKSPSSLLHPYELIGLSPAKMLRNDGASWSEVYDSVLTGTDELPEIVYVRGDTLLAVLTRGRWQDCTGVIVTYDCGLHWKPIPSPGNLWTACHDSVLDVTYVGQFPIPTRGFEKSGVYEISTSGNRCTPVSDLKDCMIWQLAICSDGGYLLAAGRQGLHRFKFH